MLINFSVQNFLSFKDEQVLDLTSQDKKETKHTFSSPDAKLQLLHGAAIFGANASGKSNLIIALKIMKKLVLDSMTNKEGDTLEVTPFLLNSDTAQAPTQLEVEFIHKNLRYRYGFTITHANIKNEWLYIHNPETYRENRVFDRPDNLMDASIGYKYGEYLTQHPEQNTTFYRSIEKRTNAQQLFLSKAAGLENAVVLKPVYEWFRDYLLFDDDIDPFHTFEAILSGKRTEILDFLQAADLSIHDLSVEEREVDKEELIKRFQKDGISGNIQREIIDNLGAKQYKVQTVHLNDQNAPVFMPLRLESTGTRMMIEYAGTLLDVLQTGKTLVVDELENSLHPLLLDQLVRLFNNSQSTAQLIFTTHAVHLMNPDKLQKDQIWFLDKNKQQESSLYSFKDFSPRNDGRENWGKRYLHGFYGGIPYLRAFDSEEHNGD